AANALRNLDIDLEKIRGEVEKLSIPGPDKVTMGKLQQTPRAKKFIEYSIEEARNLNHNYVGTEHLLLGLLRQQGGVAVQILAKRGLTIEQARSEVDHLLGDGNDCIPRRRGRPSRSELLGRRLGLGVRKYQILCIFSGGLMTTLAGALAGTIFE